ncbi:MAG: DNA replication and repair protein RecF [Flavobacteriales bacterium CG_4_8_14_3_um_filter_35_10]|nr:MAG: DNA recombination protein RecF [Flavobacteriaceae bacterium CG1_02_35_72]PIR13687.1 MAG: DNA replication and repair protein RecF [Flavobacteriales bacterium CG11_big_fil_rev_8_21_14_0_20_35_7]PIX05900.1 MAG: DNA replication and repair protein RecF [Flavobacteriales bacterium CG_4_8_14_3_um_filter_35_10]PJA06119.1 MAG: DNA replication and repair protein RecF [Flavobacteriales bacterium CG_4_10_14_0_2_um_filter_35_18]
MHLTKLNLLNFKNLTSVQFEFDAKINCLVGANGVGKTNILDAIYYLSFTKSYFNPSALQIINHKADFFVIEGTYKKQNQDEQIVCSLKKGLKKIVKRNGKIYDKLQDHIGLLPVVMISPADRDLISEGSEIRRKFIDSVISQSDSAYLKTLIHYNKILSQRNHLLKYFAANHSFDPLNLEVYDDKLDELGGVIYRKRQAFLQIFIPIFKSRYGLIANYKETVDLEYQSDLEKDSTKQLLKENLAKDRLLQFTTVGIHKDDLEFKIGGFPIKKYGSQGQQKSYLIALKLAQFEFIKSITNDAPILLLDDIFDKLDENRVLQLISLVNQDNFGQLFISDTHAERTENVVKQINQSYKMFKITE